jgi:hypothetical protein
MSEEAPIAEGSVAEGEEAAEALPESQDGEVLSGGEEPVEVGVEGEVGAEELEAPIPSAEAAEE